MSIQGFTTDNCASDSSSIHQFVGTMSGNIIIYDFQTPSTVEFDTCSNTVSSTDIALSYDGVSVDANITVPWAISACNIGITAYADLDITLSSFDPSVCAMPIPISRLMIF